MGWIGSVRCDKLRRDFVAQTFALVRNVSAQVSQGGNGRKCNKTVRNAPKHEFRLQWGGLGAFVVKNSDVTSWHELLH